VLHGIDLAIADGEFMVLVGPSGCGKSTLLRMLAGLESITGGEIRVGDRRVNELPPKARDIAMVFQSYALYPHLSVYDNIAFGLRRSGAEAGGLPFGQRLLVGASRSLPKSLRYLPSQEAQIRQRVLQVASSLQIEPLLTRLPKQLSGGQKQRVALGRAIARNPQVFLMDEPLSNLDAKLRAETRAQIVSLQRDLGVTTIYVTHDQVEAMTMGQRIAVMAGGVLQQVGTPLEIYNRPANRFVAEFIGSPPMNFIPVTVQSGPAQVCSQGVSPAFRLPLPSKWQGMAEKFAGRTLWLGVRPEHLSWGAAATQNLQVKVQQVEALGSETYVMGTLGDSEVGLQARLNPDYLVRSGDEVWLSMDVEKLYFFDPESQAAIGWD
jgi:multiple sugar transport system ATP-binding protein